MKTCTVCRKSFDSEDAPILIMGAYGSPKYLCPECAADLDVATLGRDFDEIGAAMERLGARMSNTDPDKLTYDTMNGLLASAADRAKAIAAGEYDFSLDEQSSEDSFDELPPELLETDEDRALDEKEAAALARFDKWFNWVAIGVVAGALAFVAWRLIERLL